MKTIRFVLFGLALALLFAGCTAMHHPQAQADPDRRDVLYTCNCGPDCQCNTVSTEPGKCACGVPLKWGHVIKVEGNEAILCQCAEGCKCAGLDPNDKTKCVCGNPVKRVNLEGTGIFFCNCGGSCTCNTVGDEPGECKCGMKLKEM